MKAHRKTIFHCFLLAATVLSLSYALKIEPYPINGPIDSFALATIGKLERKLLENYLDENQQVMIEDFPDRIIGGADANNGDAPFLVQLYRRMWNKNNYLCGGSLINSKTILTAGHCVSFFYNYRIRYGTNNRLSSPYPDLEIKTMKLHPKFDMNTVQNDLALFILKKPIQPSSNVQYVKLQDKAVSAGTNATLFGFGLTKGNGKMPANKLQKTTLMVMNEDECAKYIAKLKMKKTPGMFCARAPNRSACNGDSGGPLVDSKSGRQIGIVSFGTRSCPPGAVNVYTNVSYYMDWINSNKES